MPILDVLIVSVIVLAFAVFAVVLAWVEYQTRHPDRARQPSRPASSRPVVVVRAVTPKKELLTS